MTSQKSTSSLVEYAAQSVKHQNLKEFSRIPKANGVIQGIKGFRGKWQS